MVGLPLWAVFAVAFGSPLLAFLGVVTAQWFPRKSDRELEGRSRREETMRTLRWAAELAVSDHVGLVELGRSQLLTLRESALVGVDEREFVAAAIEAGLRESDDDVLPRTSRTMEAAVDQEGGAS